MSRGPGKAMRFVLESLSKRSEMSVVELAERYTVSDPTAQPWNHLYIIRRACKKLHDVGDIDLRYDEETGKLIAKKSSKLPTPWEVATAELDEHFRKQNEKAAKTRKAENKKMRNSKR